MWSQNGPQNTILFVAYASVYTECSTKQVTITVLQTTGLRIRDFRIFPYNYCL